MKPFESTTSQVSYRPAWYPPGRVVISIGLIATGLLLCAGPLDAHTFVRVALDSNILLRDGRVIFAQGTGSLTALDLQTGQVLARKKPAKPFSYSGNLQNSPYGVLMTAYDRIALLDGSTFDPLWQAGQCHAAVTDGDYVVSSDGNHTVHCRKTQSGQVCWTADMEGGWHLTAAKGKVLVSTPDYFHDESALLLLDLASGRTLLQQKAPPGVHWQQVYFDGELIYLLEAVHPEPGTLSTLDLRGKLLAKVRRSSPEVVTRMDGRFVWDDKYFDGSGRVRHVDAQERKVLVDSWTQTDRAGSAHDLGANGILVCLQKNDAAGESGQLLRMIMPTGSWDAYAPHLGPGGKVSQVSQGHGRLLLGTSEGHVECLDLETGRPHWLYRFPVVNQTMSYTAPHGMPPYLTQQAAAYQNGARQVTVASGSMRLPQGFDPDSTRWSELRNSTVYTGTIILDPDPDDPFADVGSYLFWVVVCALLPIIAEANRLVIQVWRRSRYRAGPQIAGARSRALLPPAAWCLALSVSPAIGLLLYGRVSQPGTLALKVIYALAILGVSCGILRHFFAERWLSAFVLSGILLGWVYFMFYPWWFA